jgi:hypothetical protein
MLHDSQIISHGEERVRAFQEHAAGVSSSGRQAGRVADAREGTRGDIPRRACYPVVAVRPFRNCALKAADVGSLVG